jgi:hypothetical protein
MAEDIHSALLEADPVGIKAWIDGLTGSTLNQVTMQAYGSKILVTVNIDNP